MYIKQIYDEWDLHPDATQLEIKYRFITSFIDILDTKTLTKTDISRQTIKVNDQTVIEKWKSYKVQKILKQFKDISSLNDNQHQVLPKNESRLEAFFYAGQILNELKVTNYKASSLEVYYEPRLLMLAKIYLQIEDYEKWVCSLSDRIFSINEEALKSYIGRKFNWVIETDLNHLRNNFWFLENCALFFKDITSWFYALIQTNQLTKDRAINIVNHLLIYGLTDFYAKYYTEVNQDSFQHVYRNLLIEIALDVNAQSFALTVFTEIAMFLHALIRARRILGTDPVIKNYLGIIKICCSQKNYDKFNNLIFDNEPVNASAVTNDGVKTKPVNFNIQPTAPITPTANFEIPVVPTRRTQSLNQTSSNVMPSNDRQNVNHSEQMTIPFFEPSGIDTATKKDDKADDGDLEFNTIAFDVKGD